MIMVIAGFILSIGCRHTLPDPLLPSGSNMGGPCSADTVYFVNDILPIISSNCAMAGCHDAVTRKEGVELTGYNSIKKEVSAGRSSNSKLYEVLLHHGNDRMPPPPKPALTAEQISKIRTWIDQGARYNYCARCDTTDFKYSTAVSKIIESRCFGCHNPNNINGGVDLSNHANTAAYGLNGKLYGSVSHASGYYPMPKNATKIPDCEIMQIKKWIDAGAPNN
jgi:mono/diheme cytochrome c family protein